MSTPDNSLSPSLPDNILSTIGMESNVVWSERFTLDLPPDISRDKSELDYLRRTNEEAWEATPKPRLRQANARKLRPIVIVRPILVSWAAEFLGHLATAVEKPDDKVSEAEKHTVEDSRRDSGVDIEPESPNTLARDCHCRRDSGVDVEFQSSKNLAEDCYCRRDSGIAMDSEDEQPYQTQAPAYTSCYDDKQGVIDEGLFFENDAEELLPIDPSMIGIAM